MNHADMLMAALVLGCVSMAAPAGAADPQQQAQAPAPRAQATQDPDASSGVSWLTGYRFHLSAASVRDDDPRFDWDAHFGGDVDLVDYGFGRVGLLADYEVMIGSEFRTIDPNQGVYHLDVSTSVRSGPTEVAAFFDHVSRHLSDRANHTAVSWNSAGVLATTTYRRRAVTARVDVRAAKVVQAAFVDYRWQLGAGADVEYPLSRRAALIAMGRVDPTLVDRSVAGRDTQVGATVEGGIRLYGTGAAVEIFAAWEQRVDPYPLERATRRWALVGFRFVNR
jgi:hypothetical protein